MKYSKEFWDLVGHLERDKKICSLQTKTIENLKKRLCLTEVRVVNINEKIIDFFVELKENDKYGVLEAIQEFIYRDINVVLTDYPFRKDESPIVIIQGTIYISCDQKLEKIAKALGLI